jgi:hypothetical protein
MEPKLKVELPVNAWNVVLNSLGQRPYLEVAEIISLVKSQADAAFSQAAAEAMATEEKEAA